MAGVASRPNCSCSWFRLHLMKCNIFRSTASNEAIFLDVALFISSCAFEAVELELFGAFNLKQLFVALQMKWFVAFQFALLAISFLFFTFTLHRMP